MVCVDGLQEEEQQALKSTEEIASELARDSMFFPKSRRTPVGSRAMKRLEIGPTTLSTTQEHQFTLPCLTKTQPLEF